MLKSLLFADIHLKKGVSRKEYFVSKQACLILQ